MARYITITNPQTQAKAYLFTGDQDDRSYACTEYASGGRDGTSTRCADSRGGGGALCRRVQAFGLRGDTGDGSRPVRTVR
jgi:hypothetical protein